MTTVKRYVEIEHCCDCPRCDRDMFCWAKQRPCESADGGIPDWCPLPVILAAECDEQEVTE